MHVSGAGGGAPTQAQMLSCARRNAFLRGECVLEEGISPALEEAFLHPILYAMWDNIQLLTFSIPAGMQSLEQLLPFRACWLAKLVKKHLITSMQYQVS